MSQAFYLAIDLLFVILAIMAFPRGDTKHAPSRLHLNQSSMPDSPPGSSIPTITVSEVNSPEVSSGDPSQMKVRVISPMTEQGDSQLKERKFAARPGTPYIKGDFPIEYDEDESDEEQKSLTVAVE